MLFHKLQGSYATPGGITYVGGYTEAFAGQTANKTITFGGSLSGGIADTPSSGDLVIVYFGVASDAGVSIAPPAGYTSVVDVTQGGATDTDLSVSYKFVSAGDTSFTLIDGTFDATNAGAVAVQVWRNVDKNLPLNVLTTTSNATTALCDPPAITPVSEGSFIVSGGVASHLLGVQTFSSSDLTEFLTSGANDTYDITIGLGYHEWTSGSFDPAAFTFSNADTTGRYCAATLVLNPAVASQGLTYVGGFVGSNAGTTSVNFNFDGQLTGGISSSAQVNDLIIVYVGMGAITDLDITAYSNPTVERPFVEIADIRANDTFDANLYVGWLFANDVNVTGVTVAGGNGTSAITIAVQVWRFVDTQNPFDVTATTAIGTNTLLADPPAITPSTAGSVVVSGAVGAGGTISAGDTYSSADLSDFKSGAQTETDSDAVIGLGYKTWTSGSFDPAAFTFSGSDLVSCSYAAATLALRERQNTSQLFIDYMSDRTLTSTLNLYTPSCQNNDLLIAVVFSATTTTFTAPSGWTEEFFDNSTANAVGIYSQVVSSSTANRNAWTVGDTSSGVIMSFRGVSSVNAISALARANSTSVTIGSFTATEDGITLAIGMTENAYDVMTAPSNMVFCGSQVLNAPEIMAMYKLQASGTVSSRGFAYDTSGQLAGIQLQLS